jgi:DeoR/GlpR family transcriptional regulator of sugar metabolism
MVRKSMYNQMPRLEDVVDKNVFVMMRYRKTDRFRDIENIIRTTLGSSGLYARLASDLPKDQLLWPNVTKYMDACRFGIVVLDSFPLAPDEQRLNPNICTEVGYMFAKGKKCLILKDEKLILHTDLQGFVFQSFDGENLETLRKELEKWVDQQVTILPIFQSFVNLLPDSKVALRILEEQQAKLAIGTYIVEEYLLKKPQIQSIILDSGTSAAAVAEALFLNRKRFHNFYVHTNNLLASLLLGSSREFNCRIVPGQVDQYFAGVFGPTACESIQSCGADTAILACTSFTAELGPGAHSQESIEFKRSIIENNNHTIIIVPSKRIGKKTKYHVIPDAQQWNDVLEKNVEMVIACPRLEKKAFKDIVEKLGGKLKIVSL